MADSLRDALLIAVTHAVKARRSALGHRYWWAEVATVMASLTGKSWTVSGVRNGYRDRVKDKSYEDIAAMAVSVDPEVYRAALETVFGELPEPPKAETFMSLPAGVEFPDLKEKPAPGWAASYLDAIIAAQEIMEEQDTTQIKVPIRVPEELPYATCFSGDWHIGGRGTNHRLLKDYLYLWKRTPGMGLVGMGDYGELFMGNLARIGVQEHVMPPDMQIAAATDLIETELGETLIALMKGNHDNWAGQYHNFVQTLAQRLSVPYLGVGGEIHLTVGQIMYRLAVWHRYPGAGAVNKGNNQRRASVDHNGPDVTALAHLHYQYGELSRNGEVDQVRCRSGALKVSDEHSRDAAGNIFADTRMPCVIYHPTRRSMLYFDDFRTAIEPLIHYRKRWHQHKDWTTDPAWLTHLLTPGA